MPFRIWVAREGMATDVELNGKEALNKSRYLLARADWIGPSHWGEKGRKRSL
jgi:hypothetical protein